MFRDRVGVVKVTNKVGLRFCRNCKIHYIGLYRKENKYRNCSKAEHREYKEKPRYIACLQDHKSDDLKCPLRPRRAGNQ